MTTLNKLHKLYLTKALHFNLKSEVTYNFKRIINLIHRYISAHTKVKESCLPGDCYIYTSLAQMLHTEHCIWIHTKGKIMSILTGCFDIIGIHHSLIQSCVYQVSVRTFRQFQVRNCATSICI